MKKNWDEMNILIGIYVGLIVFKFRNITLFFIWLFAWGPPPNKKRRKIKINFQVTCWYPHLVKSRMWNCLYSFLGKQIPLLRRRIVDKQFLYYIGPNRIEIRVKYCTKCNYFPPPQHTHTHTQNTSSLFYFSLFNIF